MCCCVHLGVVVGGGSLVRMEKTEESFGMKGNGFVRSGERTTKEVVENGGRGCGGIKICGQG